MRGRISEEELIALLDEIWSLMVGMKLLSSKATYTRYANVRMRDMLIGCVKLTGDLAGVVSLSCPRALATTAAAAMLDREPETLTVDHLKDAIGELTNMAAGNIASMSGERCRVSTPAVVVGADYACSGAATQELYDAFVRSRPIAQVPLECDGHAMLVTLWRAQSSCG